MKLGVLPHITPEFYEEAASLPRTGIYHDREWHRFLNRVFGWRIRAVAGRDAAGRLVWYLPFVTKMRTGLRRRNVALPLSHRLGPLTPVGVGPRDPDLGRALASMVSDLEVHDDCSGYGFHRYTTNSITTLDLTGYGTPEALLKTLDYKSVRYPINRARREGIAVTEAVTDEHYRDLYDLTVETRHRQGAPVYPRNFFTELRVSYADTGRLDVLLAYVGARPVAAVVFLYSGDSALYGYSASTNDTALKRLGGTDLVMWSAIERSMARGCRLLDFGSSPVALPGLRAYKEKWGGHTETLWYSALGPGAGGRTPGRTSPVVRAGTAVFRRLPQSVFRGVTPPIFRLVI